MATTQKTIFIDIETVSCIDTTSKEVLDKRLQSKMGQIWQKRYGENNTIDKMPLYPEFSKIIAIGIGTYDNAGNFVTKSLVNDDEKQLLVDVSKILDRGDVFIGHNIQGFDYPFMMRRFVINNIIIPKKWDLRKKKPYEITDIIQDTMILWKFGMWNGNAAGLETICNVLGISDPKTTGITGAEVNALYYASQGSDGLSQLFKDQVAAYVQADVVATKEVYERISLSYNNI